jgi:protein SCO1/2
MNSPNLSRRTALFLLAATACAPLMAVELPGNSVYQLHAPLVDQNGEAFDLASVRGQPVLISMFYSSCDMVCPMIFETIQQTVDTLAPSERGRIRIVMISFDPARDTVPVLKKTAEAHGCDARWTLARTDEANARKIAALLGVQYRRLSNGDFNHSSTIQLLDADGRIAARTGTLGSVDPKLVQATRRALSGHA